MSFELDEDILQDFLVEAGEILELLSEQLVELENNPEDKELLNAIFRGFHTVKGGAGFLSLTELVDTCHGAENVFDILRNGQRDVSSSLMDTMLTALDTVNRQFQAVQDQEPLPKADQALLDELHRLSSPQSADEAEPEASAPAEAAEPETEASAPEEPAAPSSDGDSGGSIDEITQDDFDKLLDELHGEGGSPIAASEPAGGASEPAGDASGDITDDEFEKLLDDLHGSGKSPVEADNEAENKASAAPQGGDDGLMTDDDFDKLLDDLHGSGKGPLEAPVDNAEAPKEAPKEVTPPPEPKAEQPAPPPPKPAEKAAPPAKKEAAPPAQSKKPQAEATVRVDTSTLDVIMNMVGELVLVRIRLLSLGLNSNDEEMA